MGFHTGDAGDDGGATMALEGAVGIFPLSNGVQSGSVAFVSPFANTNFIVNCSIFNATDLDPIFLSIVVTGKTVNGFNFLFNAPTDSANYSLYWSAINV